LDRIKRIFTHASPVTRPVEKGDKQRLANLIHFEPKVHRHLDWRAPLDWIGYQPFILIERGTQIQAALACPPDPPGIAWIHLFAVASDIDPSQAWKTLWPTAQEILYQGGCKTIVAISLQDWFRRILLGSGFQLINQVIMLEWKRVTIPQRIESPALIIRPLEIQDMPILEALDHAAFGPIWHNSSDSLEFAFHQAAIATVAEVDGEIVAYQISTATQMGGHLARLATRPDFQRLGIGTTLLQDLLNEFVRRGALRITVNTQQDNKASISLYEKAGFVRTGESYPVYQYNNQQVV
jgi:ribosomal protein S18 acetylase RimI-like enzyme